MASSYLATPLPLSCLQPDVTPLSKSAASPASVSTAALSGSLSEISPMSNSILENAPTATALQGKQQSTQKTNQQILRDNAVAMQLTKTKMCAFFERGKCASMNCKYAHSADELRSLPNLQKTKICKAFMQGNCNYGDNCMYAHGDADLRVTKGIYKTQICNFYERGYCRKGDRCNHAHGAVEMRAHQDPSSQNKENVKKAEPPMDTAKQSQQRLPLAELLLQPPPPSNPVSAMAAAPPAVNFIPPPPAVPAPSYTAPSRTMPTPTKSVTDVFALAASPLPSTPMWGQYGLHSLLSPVPGQDPSPMWPRDPIDVLLVNTPDSVGYNQRYDKYGHYAHALGAPPVPPPPMAPPPPTWAATGADELEHMYQNAAFASRASAPPSFVFPTPTTPPSLAMCTFATPVDLDTSGNDDNVALDLNKRLASLDAACKELSAEATNYQAKNLRHRI